MQRAIVVGVALVGILVFPLVFKKCSAPKSPPVVVVPPSDVRLPQATSTPAPHSCRSRRLASSHDRRHPATTATLPRRNPANNGPSPRARLSTTRAIPKRATVRPVGAARR